jgi:hypothetical protein
LSQALFELVDELIALFHDVVFDLEDVLPLAPLLAFEFLYLFLNQVLLFEGYCLTRLAAQGFDLFLRVGEIFFGGVHHVISPLFKLLAGVVEMPAVLFQRPAYRRFAVTLPLSSIPGDGVRLMAMNNVVR